MRDSVSADILRIIYNQRKQLIHLRFVGYLHSERIVDIDVYAQRRKEKGTILITVVRPRTVYSTAL
jgi:hypothetical protein